MIHWASVVIGFCPEATGFFLLFKSLISLSISYTDSNKAWNSNYFLQFFISNFIFPLTEKFVYLINLFVICDLSLVVVLLHSTFCFCLDYPVTLATSILSVITPNHFPKNHLVIYYIQLNGPYRDNAFVIRELYIKHELY